MNIQRYFVLLCRLAVPIVCAVSINNAFSACPITGTDPNDLPSGYFPPIVGILENINGLTDRGRIVGCQTDGITDNSTTIHLTKNQLTGSASMDSLSLGSYSANAPVGSGTIMINGGTIPSYPLSSIGYKAIPTASSGVPALYHFYSQCRYNWNLVTWCQSNRSSWFLQGLRENTDIFTLNGQTGTRSNVGNELVSFEEVELSLETDSNKKILANIKFLYKNMGRVENGRGQGFIHFAIWAEIQPITSPSNLNYIMNVKGKYGINARIEKNNFINHVTNRY